MTSINMERPSGPLGTATQTTGRIMADNGVLIRPTPSNTTRIGSNGAVQHVASNSSLSTQIPISAGQVITIAREAMKNALDENQTKAAEASGVSNELKPGVTIDLSHKNIQKFPEEVVDIIKNELERLALSHNLIATFPARFSECTSLRYLNVRNNVIRDFPLAICELSSLEILDLGRNKLRILPNDLSKLSSLKVLSVQKNRIEDLPLCIAEMLSLQVLKLDGNPIRFPPKEILQPQASSPPNSGYLMESEGNDVAVTAQIKRFLKQKAISERSETESGGEESSEGAETPRPLKRVMSGRFPIKVNGTDVPDLRSPAMPRPPPIPSRSHYRGLSQQNAALRRPGVLPLTISNSNERLRSNSESLPLSSREKSDRSDRTRRMGIVTKKPSELGTLIEIKTNRYSHYRGLSHGSAIQNANANGVNASRSPATPTDSSIAKGTYIRRLSSLPERKRESSSPDPVIEGAKGVLFALFQIHPLIQSLIGLTRDGSNKRTSLERVFYNASNQVEELDKDIQTYDTYSEEDEENNPRSNENVRSACLTCVLAYIHVCGLLSRNIETLLDNGDPRYIRTLLLYVYGSLAEVRNAGASLFAPTPGERSKLQPVMEDTVRPLARDKSATPTRERPGLVQGQGHSIGPRSRSATVVQHPNTLRVTTDTRLPFMNSTGRSATMTSATPRSGESFASSLPSGGRNLISGDFNDEDRLFERIFLGLQQSSEMAIETLPSVNHHFVKAMRSSIQHGNRDQLKQYWQTLSQKCSVALQTADALKARLSSIKLKEPGIRTQGVFWELCTSFINAYYNLVVKVKEVKSMTSLLPNEAIMVLRPLQKTIRETGQLIEASPWSFLAGSGHANGPSSGTSYASLQSPASQVPLPMTPASAALGPAVQATVPSTPQSAPYNPMWSRDVFERADALLSMKSSINTFRTGTMSSAFGTTEGPTGPMSMISPMSSMSSRYNGSDKFAF